MSTNSIAVIFGGAGGFGCELYPLMKARYDRVITVDIQPFDDSDEHLLMDMTDEQSLSDGIKYLSEFSRLDAIIFATGFGALGSFLKQNPSLTRKVFQINFTAPVEILRLLSPQLLRSGGHAVFLGSTSAYLPSQDWLMYAVAKSSLDHFCRSLAMEWRGRALVSIVHPGPMKTQMHQGLGMDLQKIGWHKFRDPAWMAKKVMKHLHKPQSYSYRWIPEGKQRALVRAVVLLRPFWEPILKASYAKKMFDHR